MEALVRTLGPGETVYGEEYRVDVASHHEGCDATNSRFPGCYERDRNATHCRRVDVNAFLAIGYVPQLLASLGRANAGGP
jgi:hypothetical protein